MVLKKLDNKKNINSNLRKFFFFLPSLITFCSIFCGLWAIYILLTGKNIELAICCVAISAICDGFDGRIARLLGFGSDFGLELDSLADFFSFGIVPMLIYFCSYNWNNDFTSFALLMLFPIGTAIRLARFNVGFIKDTEIIQNYKKQFFFGIPAPMGALLFLIPVILSNYNFINQNKTLNLFKVQ